MCTKTFAALTERVVESLSDISTREQGHIIYDLDQGSAITFTLHRNANSHVLRAFLSAGTIFPLHNHEASAETLILETGNITVMSDGQGDDQIRQELREGVPMWIPEKLNHFLHAKEDSWILAILIPPDQGMLK